MERCPSGGAYRERVRFVQTDPDCTRKGTLQTEEDAMKALGEMTAAEHRAHERAFGVELARNLRTARGRIGWSSGRPSNSISPSPKPSPSTGITARAIASAFAAVRPSIARLAPPRGPRGRWLRL